MTMNENGPVGPAAGARTIVVGLDASPEATRALAWAQDLAGPTDSIVVVRGWEMPVFVSGEAPDAVYAYDFEQLAADGLAETMSDVDDPRVRTVLRRSHAGRAIVEEAAGADLVVVGHRGDSRIKMMLGSTANYVLHHATCPVAIVRGDHEPGHASVVVGVDAHDLPDERASNPSVRGLQWAYALRGVREVTALHGWFIPPIAIGMFATPTVDVDAMDESAHAVIDRALAAAGPPPDSVNVVAKVARDAGGRSLIEASKDADLVVVGSRGRGGFAELLLGSTTSEVAAHSHTTVVVIR